MRPKLDPATLEWRAEHMNQLEHYQKTLDLDGRSAGERLVSGSRMLMAQETADFFRSKVEPRRFDQFTSRARYCPEIASGVGIVAAALLHYLVDFANNNYLGDEDWFTIPAAELAHGVGVSARRLTDAAALLVEKDVLEVRYDGPNWRRHFRVKPAVRLVLQ